MKNKTLKIAAVVLVAVMCAACLVACVPGNPDKAKENLEAKDYKVVLAKGESFGIKLANGLESSLSATNGDGEHIDIYYYDSAKNANAAFKEHKDKLSPDDKSKMKENGIKMGSFGKCWYVGSEQAVKDAG